MTSAYSPAFFDSIEDGSLESAREVVPILLEFIHPTSVIDVGCGRGAWLKAFQENGLSSVYGLDGGYVDMSSLLFPTDRFISVDLSKPFAVNGRHELALCLEVAEHLPAAMSSDLVRALTTIAPLVLFSAAIPGQGGTNHINEQWPSYWEALFREQDYVLVDFLRPRIRDNPRIKWWYRQNIVLYACREAVRNSAALEHELEKYGSATLNWIYASVLQNQRSVSVFGRPLPKMILTAVLRRLKAGCPW